MNRYERGNQFLAPRANSDIKIENWRPIANPTGATIGFFRAVQPTGMAINDLKLMVSSVGTYWIGMPATKRTNRDGTAQLDVNGKPIWTPIVEFISKEARDLFSEKVLAALRQAHPEAFGGAP